MANRSDKSSARLIPVALAFFALSACDLLGEPVARGKAVDGQVLESGTGKPIPGAVVVATWSGIVGSLAHSQGVCFHVESTASDERGGYHIPAWEKRTRFARAKHQTVAIIAFKPGYSFISRSADNTVRLEGFTGTREERLNKIRSAGVMCGSADESQKNLLLLYRALYEEARDLVVTKRDKQIVNELLYKIDLIELPYDEVLRRVDERNDALRKEFLNE